MTSHICRACYILQTTAQGVLKLELLLLHSSRAYALVHYVARCWSVTPSACSRFTGLLGYCLRQLRSCTTALVVLSLRPAAWRLQKGPGSPNERGCLCDRESLCLLECLNAGAFTQNCLVRPEAVVSASLAAVRHCCKAAVALA